MNKKAQIISLLENSNDSVDLIALHCDTSVAYVRGVLKEWQNNWRTQNKKDNSPIVHTITLTDSQASVVYMALEKAGFIDSIT